MTGIWFKDPFDLLYRRDAAVSVSHGAVFRAMNKSDGPKRIVQSNFGFLQIEERNLRLAAHRVATPTDGDIDGKMYIKNVLDWVIKKVVFFIPLRSVRLSKSLLTGTGIGIEQAPEIPNSELAGLQD